MDVLYRWLVIAIGIALFVINLIEIAKKKMDVSIGSSWTIMSVALIIFGITFDFTILNRNVNVRNIILFTIFIVSIVAGLYMSALRITELKKKNTELAIYVSMLKSEKGDRHDVVRPPVAVQKEASEEENTGVGA